MRESFPIMKLFKPIKISLKDPECNACDNSTLFTSDTIYKTYAILNNSGECIECQFKGLNCLPNVVVYDTDNILIEIIPNISFILKLKLKEYVNTIS